MTPTLPPPATPSVIDFPGQAAQLAEDGFPVTECVTVLVTITAQGVDAEDARNRAAASVRNALRDGGVKPCQGIQLQAFHAGYPVPGMAFPVRSITAAGVNQ